MTTHEEGQPRAPFDAEAPLGPTGLAAVTRGERDEMGIRYTAKEITDGQGLGFGNAEGISRIKVEADAGADAVQKVDELIASPRILVGVGRDADNNIFDDDGCGDGRMAGLIRRGRAALRVAANSIRAKVFGGGSAMATADIIGSGEADSSLFVTFGRGIRRLADGKIGFGAHEDTHAHGPKCGCGAIDRAPEVVVAVGEYSTQIGGVFNALASALDGTQDPELGRLLGGNHLGNIVKNYQNFAEIIKGQEYQGSAVMDAIAGEGKIIKRLEGEHIEARIILNFVRGMTVNQQLVHEVSDGKVDVFAVDVWRLQDLAVRLHPDDEAKQQRALQSMLTYTLGVAAVLTAGDLPVYVIKPVEEPADIVDPEPALSAA